MCLLDIDCGEIKENEGHREVRTILKISGWIWIGAVTVDSWCLNPKLGHSLLLWLWPSLNRCLAGFQFYGKEIRNLIRAFDLVSFLALKLDLTTIYHYSFMSMFAFQLKFFTWHFLRVLEDLGMASHLRDRSFMITCFSLTSLLVGALPVLFLMIQPFPDLKRTSADRKKKKLMWFICVLLGGSSDRRRRKWAEQSDR